MLHILKFVDIATGKKGRDKPYNKVNVTEEGHLPPQIYERGNPGQRHFTPGPRL